MISYLNTDLDLTSSDDLTALAATFEAQGVSPLHVTTARMDYGMRDSRPTSNTSSRSRISPG